MQQKDVALFSRAIDKMTLAECVSEIESLDRLESEVSSATKQSEPPAVDITRRRAELRKALTHRPANCNSDALAKFRWVLYESQNKPALTAANADDLVLVMKQVAARPRTNVA
ncbi:MAG: hypothetical protein OEM59_17065 [Rhodospirillales bacterium]|nr:hypothetical protein [Rhodospirillales bacterium]